MDAGLQMIFPVRLLHVDHSFTGDIIEKCLLLTSMHAVLPVGETQLGKNLQDSIGKRPFTGRYLSQFIL